MSDERSVSLTRAVRLLREGPRGGLGGGPGATAKCGGGGASVDLPFRLSLFSSEYSVVGVDGPLLSESGGDERSFISRCDGRGRTVAGVKNRPPKKLSVADTIVEPELLSSCAAPLCSEIGVPAALVGVGCWYNGFIGVAASGVRVAGLMRVGVGASDSARLERLGVMASELER